MFKTKRDVDRHVTHILSKLRSEKEKLSRGFQFAKLYHEVGDHVAAKRHLQGFLSVQQTVSQAHRLLGQIHESLREKQQALEAYKRSLDLSPDQNDLILKVCELYSDVDISANKDTIEFWIDKAEKHFPDNLTIFKLKERLIDKDGGADWEELENLISRELMKNPENVQMHMKLVCLLQRHRGVEPAYEHAIMTEKTLAFVSFPDWYECLLQLFQAYEEEKDCKDDVAFQTFKLFAQTSLAFLKLRSEERDLTAAINVIHQLDQTVFECCGIQKQTADWTGFLTEMKGQLLYLVGLLLLKRALKGQMQWRDAKSFSVLCFLLGEAMKPMDLNSRWFQQVPKDSHKFYERVQMLGYDRLSQGGHMIHELKMNESGWAAKLRQRLWTPQGREGLYSLLFTSNEVKRKKTTSFLLQDDSLSNTSFQVPAREHLIMYDSVAFTLHASSLNHLVWLALRYFKEDVQADYEQLFKCQLYPDLKFSSSDMSSGDPGSLSQLDVQSFFYACVKWTSLDLIEKKRSLHSITDKPDLLPVCLTTSLCPRPQSEWWSAVYKMEATNGSCKLSQVWGVVMRGLETIRLISPHTLSLPMVVMLAKNMDKRVHEMESLRANIVTPKLTALQARAAFYWGAAQDILDKQERNIPVKQPKEMLFPDNCGSSLAQTKELREQIRFALAQINMREERYEDALKGFEGLGMSEASFFSGQIYRTMAVNFNSNDNSSDDTQMMLLTKAKNSLYQALDSLKSGKNGNLEHQIKQELDDVVCKLISLESGGSLVDSFLSEKSVHDSLTDCKGRDEEDAIGRQPSFHTQVLSTPTRVREPHCISPTRIDVQMRALETTNTALCARLATLEETVRSNVKTIQEVFSQLREARDEIKSLRNELQVVAFQGLSTMSGMAMPRAPIPQPFPGTPQTRGLINTMNTSYGAGMTYDYGAQGAAAIPPHMAQYGYPVTGSSPRPGSAFGPQNYDEDFNNMDGEYYDPDNDYDQNLVQEWPFGHKAAAEGKSTITYSPHQQGVTPGVHQGGVANPAANSGMFASALRGPSLQYGNFQQPATSLPMPGPGFFSQPSPVVQPPAVPAQTGLFPSPGQMGVKTGINPASQAKPVTPTMPQASAGKSATPIMPPNAVASQSMESKPKLIAGSVGIPTPKKDQEVVQLMPNAGGFLAAHGQVSPGSAAAKLSQLAAKHQESSKSPVAPAANTVATTPQKTVFGGFTFTSTPKITDPKKSAAAQSTSTATFIPKPFSGFSLSAPISKTASTGPGAFTVSPSARKQNLSTCSDDHIDEYEPNVDFKPVVPLPELIEVKTGEEDEDRMFCERAKLFRFDPETKQWKERGLGEMKILKHKQTKVVRILMRREQVLKLCANHRLTKEMKLMPMASLDKAWVWEAMDFSEEEMKYERLACKFKTADIASKFKEAFESCQKEMSSDSTGQVKKVEENTKPKDQHATPKDQQATSSKPDLSTMFKSKPGSWTCDGCFIKNNAEILECPCCKTLKPGVKKEDVKPASTLSVQPTFGSSAKPVGTTFTFGGTSSSTGAFKFGAPAAGSLPGSEQGKVPLFGGQPGAASSSGKGFTFTPSTLAAATTADSTSTGFKFASSSATTSSSIFGATTTTTASSSSGGFVFGSPAAGSGGFQFGTPPGQNAQSTSIFPAASTAGEAPKSTPFNLPQPCKPSSGFTFDTGSANSTTATESGSGQSLLAKVLSEESPSTKGFPFSPAKSLFTTTDPATSKPLFGMASTLGAANKSDFTFGNNPSLGEATSSTTKSSGFTFSMSMTPTKTTSPVKSPGGFKSPTSPGVNEEGYYVNKEEEDSHIHFEPIIKLPDKVEVVTGEEDEEVLFVHRAKLFRLVNKEWKERGLGEMKILYNNQTKKARLLMRREQILKMCCNHYISPEIKFTHMPNSKGCVLVWFAIDFSEENEGTSEQLSIKFKTPEVVAKFLEGVAEARRRCAGGVETIGAAGKYPTKAAADNGDDDDDDVIFVKEEKASAEEIQKARDFMLPDNFYLYLKCKPCPGCRGCEDRMPEEDAPRSSGSKGNLPVTESADDKKMEEVEEEEDKKKNEEEEEEDEEEGEEDEEEEEEDETEEYDSDTEEVVKAPGVFGMGSSEPTFDDMQATGSSEFVFGSSSAGFSFSDFARKDPNAFKSSEGKPFHWQGAGAQLFGRGGGSAGDDGEDGDDDATEQGDEPHFEPVIALPDLVEVKTGEEDETVEYAQRSKLFRFDVQTNQWKEKGIGEMKILKHKDQCRYRLLMRREQVHKLACNHLLTPDMVLTPLPTSETSWCWTAQDYAENEAKIEKFAIKFKTMDLAHEFKKRVEECQAKLRQQSIGQNESGESLMSQLLLDETD